MAARRPTILVARATFRPARFAPRAVRRTARRAFRIAFRPARRILRATRRPVRRDCRAERRLARLVRRLARLACLFLRGMFSSLMMMCQCASFPTHCHHGTGIIGAGHSQQTGSNHTPSEKVVVNCYFPRVSNTCLVRGRRLVSPCQSQPCDIRRLDLKLRENHLFVVQGMDAFSVS